MERELPETQPGSAPPGTLIQKQGQERCQQPAVARGWGSLGSGEHALPIPAAGVGDTGRELLPREGITVGRACPVSRERFGGAVGKAAVGMRGSSWAGSALRAPGTVGGTCPGSHREEVHLDNVLPRDTGVS